MVEVALGEGTVGQQQGSPGVEPRDDNKSRRRGWQRVTSFYTSNCSSSQVLFSLKVKEIQFHLSKFQLQQNWVMFEK